MICIPALAEQAGLNLTWSKNPEDTFSRDVAQSDLGLHCLLIHICPTTDDFYDMI